MPQGPTPDERADLRNTARQIVEAQIRLFGALFDKAAAYSNLILAVGYASVFAVWSAVREHLQPIDERLSGALLLVSLSAFVAYEIYKVLLVSLATRKRAKALSGSVEQLSSNVDAFVAKLEAMEIEHAHIDAKAGKYWPVSWGISVIAGAGAIAVLLHGALLRPKSQASSEGLLAPVRVTCGRADFEQCPAHLAGECNADTTVFVCTNPQAVVRCAANTVQGLDNPFRYLCSAHDGRSIEFELTR